MKTIEKGAMVCIRTTNGGEITGKLLSIYRPTYAVSLLTAQGTHVMISGWRIRSLAPAVVTPHDIDAKIMATHTANRSLSMLVRASEGFSATEFCEFLTQFGGAS